MIRMMAILYLLLTFIFGYSVVLRFINIKKIYNALSLGKDDNIISPYFISIPIGIIIGIILITITNYYVTYLLRIIFKNSIPIFPIGIIITIIMFSILSYINYNKRKRELFSNFSFKKNIFFIIIILIIILMASFLMFYTYHIKDDLLYAGYTTFSDMAPHSAMTSSFSFGENIPTQYPHFANDGINYHFMFYFFTGTLNYLGFPVDVAINIPSIITFVIAVVLAGVMAVLISKKKISFLILSILIFFRSSLNILFIIKDSIVSHQNIINVLFRKYEWDTITPYDNWGIWSINVYPNQRHLMLGIAVILIMILLFIPYVKDFFDDKKNKKIKFFLFNKDNWIVNKSDTFIIVVLLILISMPYFHGSALITILLIMFGMAIFSKKRLAYLMVAVLSIISSLIQTTIFSGGALNVINFQLKTGFVVENPNIINTIEYFFIITGLVSIIALFYGIKRRKQYNYLLYLVICFLLPTIFAFTFQMTEEMLANHKFIQFSIILMDIVVACYLGELLSKRLIKKVLAIVLLLFLTLTGIHEWSIFININQNKMVIEYNSEEVKWIKNNTNPDDVFITPLWSLNSFFFSGRASFFGWSYYAWSAGHDTDKRFDEYKKIISADYDNLDDLVLFFKENKIKYFIDTFEYEEYEKTDNVTYNRAFYERNFPVVASFPRINTRIFKLY